MYLCYCPKCKREEIIEDYERSNYKKELTVTNTRDGYGRPIYHYKCKCGNYLAGVMLTMEDKDFIDYEKEIIELYNKNEYYYQDRTEEHAKLIYKERKIRGY